MRRGAAAVLALLAACSPAPRASFTLKLIPAGSRAQAPAGALIESAASADGTAADFAAVRFLAARALVDRAPGIWFELPPTPAGMRLSDFPEEAQALQRVIAELRAARPVIELGEDAAPAFEPPPGARERCWTLRGRRYVLLVNESDAPAPLARASLEPWRALFSVRSDARELLSPCAQGTCLPPRAVVWLEGRPSWD